jgi:excisionase family DNA binding protein
MAISAPRLLTQEEVAERLAVSVKTVRRLVERGALQFTKIGSQFRFKPEWVEAYIERKHR